MAESEIRQDCGGWEIRWNPLLAEQAVAAGDWPNRTVAEFARDRVKAHPDRIQLIENELSLSCLELYQRAQKLAGFFLSIDLQPGDVVSFELPNWWETSVIDLACAMTGVVANPIVPINRDAEVTYMLNESRSRLMFIPGVFRGFDYLAMMRRIAPDLNNAPRVIAVRAPGGPCEELSTILETSPPLAEPRAVDPNAVKLLLYTSGTTGRPKGVLHSHNSIHADSIKMQPVMHLTEEDRIFCPSPVTHISGYLWALNMPWCGNMPAVMIDTWDPQLAFDLMLRHDCAFMVGATPFLQGLVEVAKNSSESLNGLKSFLCGGASVPPSLIYEAAKLFPNCLPWRTFGATEAPTMTGPPASRADIRLAAETDGKPHHAEVKIIDLETGRSLEQGKEGEILVREPSMALGYARPEDNEGAYDEEGFFRMGDLGYVTESGHIVCTGRKKDLIIRSGENISAKEIEDVLHRSETISEVAVVSMPSKRTGEAICAFVIPAPGCTTGMQEISRLVSEAGLARQKTPEYVEIVRELPKTPSGKVRKDQLRAIASNFSLD